MTHREGLHVGRRDGRLPVYCHCERRLILVPAEDVAALRVPSCGHDECHDDCHD